MEIARGSGDGHMAEAVTGQRLPHGGYVVVSSAEMLALPQIRDRASRFIHSITTSRSIIPSVARPRIMRLRAQPWKKALLNACS